MAKTTTPALSGPAATKGGKKQKGGALVSMKDLESLYAAQAKAAAQAAPVAEGPPRISAKDQVFWVGEQVLPDPLEVIVVADAHLNVYYTTEYDPENKTPPACFALAPALELGDDGAPKAGTGEKAMAAHPTSPDAQGGPSKDGLEHPCQTCEMNAFGSARIGKGKACANNRKLAVVLANDPALLDETKELKWAELTLSPTALSPWGKFVNSLSKIEGRPPHGAVVQLSFNKTDQDERKRKAVVPIGYRLIDNVAVAHRVMKLRQEVLDSGALLRPLPVDIADKPKAAKAKPQPKGGKPAAAKKKAARF
jgi:hypothetical protein